MAWLGAFDVDEQIQITLTWVPAQGQSNVTACTCTITHSDGTVISPSVTSLSTNVFAVTTALTKAGRWSVKWVTTAPTGGVAKDHIYAQ